MGSVEGLDTEGGAAWTRDVGGTAPGARANGHAAGEEGREAARPNPPSEAAEPPPAPAGGQGAACEASGGGGSSMLLGEGEEYVTEVRLDDDILE